MLTELTSRVLANNLSCSMCGCAFAALVSAATAIRSVAVHSDALFGFILAGARVRVVLCSVALFAVWPRRAFESLLF